MDFVSADFLLDGWCLWLHLWTFSVTDFVCKGFRYKYVINIQKLNKYNTKHHIWSFGPIQQQHSINIYQSIKLEKKNFMFKTKFKKSLTLHFVQVDRSTKTLVILSIPVPFTPVDVCLLFSRQDPIPTIGVFFHADPHVMFLQVHFVNIQLGVNSGQVATFTVGGK